MDTTVGQLDNIKQIGGKETSMWRGRVKAVWTRPPLQQKKKGPRDQTSETPIEEGEKN